MTSELDAVYGRSEWGWDALHKRITHLETHVHVPKLRSCIRCEHRFVDEADRYRGHLSSAKCPRCDSVSWRVSERTRREELEREVERQFAELVERPDASRTRALLIAAFTLGYVSQGLDPDEVRRRQAQVEGWADGRKAVEESIA